MDYGQAIFQLGDWQVDPIHSVLNQNGINNKIEKRLMRVLVLLVNNSPQGVSKEQLLQQVWQGKVVSDETISVAISRLRKALGCNAKQPSYIETITGFGFKLVSPVQAHNPHAEQANKTNGKPWHQLPYLYLITALLLVSVVTLFFLSNPSSTTSLEKSELLDNETYTKALFLMQKDIKGIRQSEILLTNLNLQLPNNAEILNALGKSKYFQLSHVGETEQNKLLNQAKRHLLHAIELNPKLADAYLQLGLIVFNYERNLTDAEKYFIQAIALNPEQILTHLNYSSLLLSQRRFEEAILHNKIAQSIDPLHYSSAAIEWVYNMAEEYELAKKELAKLYSIEPGSAIYNTSAMRLYESMGEENRAFHHYKQAFKHVGYNNQEMKSANNAFAQGGLKQLNYWLANIKKEQADIGQYTPPISTARYHIAAGEFAKALTILELAHKNKNILCLWLNSDPKYAPLRKLPRFKELFKNIEISIR